MSKIFQLVGFKIGKEFFGAPIDKVKEIVRVPEVTPVPDTPDFLKGVINLRGRLIPVVEISRLMKVESEGRRKSNRVLVLELNGSTIGVVVDSASEILKISEDSVEPRPGLVSSVGAAYVTGIGKLKDRLIVLLDLTKLLNPEEMKKIESMAAPAALENCLGEEVTGPPQERAHRGAASAGPAGTAA